MDVNNTFQSISETNDPAVLKQEIDRLQHLVMEQEKLAAIGYLTAGIIHEIRNPLNFMINFSKVSASMIEEIQEVVDGIGETITGDERADLEDLSADLNANLKRITENGERAMRIIMKMLAQSREQDTVTFELTDINQLVDDTAKLAYQGIRGNNSSFNLSLKNNFDASLGTVNVDAHDLSRALLNIINNACFAMEEKKKTAPDYMPVLELTTAKTNGGFMISIKDNGTGMPQSVIDKIFTPFFTTKAKGKGTGLGLSITNDIITKIHKGTLEVHSAAGEFTEFVINIPA